MYRIIRCLALILLLSGAVDAEESPQRTIQGQWIHDGKPRAEGTVHLWGEGLNVSQDTVTDADGRFIFQIKKLGPYKLRVDLLGQQGLARETGLRSVRGGMVEQRVFLSGQELTTQLATYSTSISGYVYDADGKPQQTALLWLEPPGAPPNGWTSEWVRPSDLSDADGYFEFRGVPPGTYRLLAQSKMAASAWTWIHLTPERPTQRQDLRLYKPSPFTFRAVDSNGTPPRDLYITFTDADNRTISARILNPGDDGTFLANAPPGQWRLWLRGGQTATISHQVQAPGNGGPWHLPPLGTIRIEGYKETHLLAVRLLDAEGQPVYRTDGGLADGKRPYRSAVKAPAGPWTVEVSGPDDYFWRGKVVVVAEDKVTLQIPAMK